MQKGNKVFHTPCKQKITVKRRGNDQYNPINPRQYHTYPTIPKHPDKKTSLS